ncbi:N,N-dimethylformamidase beta subunit family domain-containing protein [Nocardiopsis trehalosi]|uniref:N,N-dimethylformamidase beta subunit family domain-containing protein n=1 Tax=Nocardiopsis trehalosi TaxID=109329 RepID=UPI000A0239AA|nr:N,N-dimethylformamidase beta subunit family domain-containing protein [Nocardiopsis trehalosi]
MNGPAAGGGLSVYATRTSVAQGQTLLFRLDGATAGRVRVRDTVTGADVAEFDVTAPEWKLDVPAEWPSSLYAARFSPGGQEAYFAVRTARPGADSPILVAVPFLTWQAYNGAGVPGAGLYPAEGPDRALRVSFDRPGGGPAGHWEDRFYRWLAEQGRRVEYCSNVDLHADPGLVGHYRMLVCAGHDEYWTAEMRDSVEAFVAAGGNAAFFCGNTCWWQVRLEDGERTLVCYRDALSDPLAATDPARTTVEWSSAPVHRPENTLLGVSFRNGAGCWEDMSVMRHAAYTVAFADHWVYAGTGLRDGDTFGRGAVGYETDAADVREVDGVPLATGADGTSRDFTVLAAADLRHWSRYGKGGRATMGVLRTGRGTVFNAATVGWADALDDPVVSRITANVLDRLGGAAPEWEPMGAAPVRPVALAACEGRLFAAAPDGTLWTRLDRTQNLPWRPLGPAPGLVALSAPGAAVPGCPVGLYGLFADGRVRLRPPAPGPADWTDLYPAPSGAVDLHPVDEHLYVLTGDGRLWRRPLAAAGDAAWSPHGDAAGLTALTGMNGRLFAVGGDGVLRTRRPGDTGWTDLCAAPGLAVLTAVAGRITGATADGGLSWRDVTTMTGAPPARPEASL